MKTILSIAGEGAQRVPDDTALMSENGEALSYGALHLQVVELVEQLRALGLGRTDHVAVVMPNGLAMATLCYAVCCGAVCAPLNPDYRVEEFEFHLELLDAAAVVVPTHMPSAVLTAAARLSIPVLTLSGSAGQGDFRFSRPDTPIGSTSMDRLSPEADDIALLLHTSGTTARPKLVPLTHRNICTTVSNLGHALELSRDDRCLSMMPLFHVGGLVDLLFSPLAAGGSIVFMPHFSAPHLLSFLKRFNPTWTQVVPTMLQAILDTYEEAPQAFDSAHRLRVLRVVAAALSPDLVKAWAQNFPRTPLVEVYGMTETATLIATNPLPPAKGKPGSVGKAAGPRIAIADEYGEPVASGEPGEILVAGDNVMPGYLKVDNASTFHGDWFRTGDWGHLDADGDLFITGRIKEIINRAGEKVSPAEIDEVLLSHPDVAEAATFGLAHETLGEQIAAAVVTRPGAQLEVSTIIDHLRRGVAPFKVPARIFIREELPRTANGKIRRAELSKEYADRPENVGRAQRDNRADQALDPLETKLVALWRKVLKADDIGAHDDFFDLGGDSLATHTFIIDLCAGSDETVFPAALYDASTIAEFSTFLRAAHPALCERLSGSRKYPAMGPSVPATAKPSAAWTHWTGDGRLRRDEYENFLAHLTAWKRDQPFPDSLLIATRASGTRVPLYWCVGIIDSVRRLSNHLPADQPVYALRSGHHIIEETAENIDRVAATYLAQITELQPTGPYLLGGYCGGGTLAFRLAGLLRDSGRRVAMLFLHEKFVPEPIDVPVSMLFADQSNHNPRRNMPDAGLDFADLYPAFAGLQQFPGEHTRWFEPPTVTNVAHHITRIIEQLDLNEQDPAARGQSEGTEPEVTVAEISVPRMILFRPGHPMRFTVELTNRSGISWNSQQVDKLTLAGLLSRGKQTTVAYTKLAHVPRPIADGESIRIPVQMPSPCPGMRWKYRLSVRLLNARQMKWTKPCGDRHKGVAVNASFSDLAGLAIAVTRKYLSRVPRGVSAKETPR